MHTETWIERTIVDQVTAHDRRYKHDYGGVEQTTDDLMQPVRNSTSSRQGTNPNFPRSTSFSRGMWISNRRSKPRSKRSGKRT